MCRTFCGVAALLVATTALAAEPDRGPVSDAKQYRQLPGNEWVLIDQEDDSGGKAFARLIYADNVDRLYLWGIGGEKPARNVYRRYELESFDPTQPGWRPAFPEAAGNRWTADNYPPFRIYGQSGPDGLKHDEGPRLKTVGGYNATNQVNWWDFDGISRPSPIHTFNMACWDSKRARIVYYSDSCTFAIDPRTNSWADLQAENHPTTCKHVAWASMCYDPTGDRILLFGGGLATNPHGAAPTWFYDCAKNRWERPTLDTEPPPRCNAPIVYDSQTQSMVLFGGYNQQAALNDTWVYDCQANRWQQRKPALAPPPMYTPATAALTAGRVLVCGNDARKIEREHSATTSADKETWVYDVAANTWIALPAHLDLPGYPWLTADYSSQQKLVFLTAFGRQRKTYALRYDPQAITPDLPGAPPGTVAWKYPEQKLSLEQAPPTDEAVHAKLLNDPPPNTFVDARPPGMLISKTWSTAVLDTDAHCVIYTGGGHSGYSGNDFARYDIARNRWSLDMAPRFPPFLEGTNAGIFGWSYGMVPFSQHTYLWYCYDPQSKTVVYLARPNLEDGLEIQLTNDPDDTFVYDSKEHGYASWVYDPERKKMLPPSFGRTFRNPWHLSLVGTPSGVFALAEGDLYHGTVDRASGAVAWKRIDSEFPKPREQIKHHYEFQPLLHDTKRDRLVQLKGDNNRVDVFVRPRATEGAWQQLEVSGEAAIGREAVYIARHDTILWLADKELYAFDCATNQLRKVDVQCPAGIYTHECALVYDPKYDVCVALIPSKFTGPMQTFLFRYVP